VSIRHIRHAQSAMTIFGWGRRHIESNFAAMSTIAPAFSNGFFNKKNVHSADTKYPLGRLIMS